MAHTAAPAPHHPNHPLRPRQAPGNTVEHLLQRGKIAIRPQPVIRRHERRNPRQPPRQLGLRQQYPIKVPGELLQRLLGIILPMPGQAMVEKHIQNDTGKAPPLTRKTRKSRQHQRVLVGIAVDMPVQPDGRLQRWREAPFQRAFDEVAIQAAKQLVRRRAAKVQVCEVVHERSLAPPAHISL